MQWKVTGEAFKMGVRQRLSGMILYGSVQNCEQSLGSDLAVAAGDCHLARTELTVLAC